MSEAKCGKCGEAITVVLTQTYGDLELDQYPAKDGTVIVRNGRAKVLGAVALRDLVEDIPRYRQHILTCTGRRGR